MQEEDMEKMQSTVPRAVSGFCPTSLAIITVAGLLFWLFVWAVVAYAHPVDDPCPPGKDTEDGCQPVVEGLGLNIPEFFAAHKKYWHSRRSLAIEIVDYGQCVGARGELQSLLGQPIDGGVESILHYWNVIPAHPELDFPGQVWRALEQTEAGEATRAIVGVLKWLCEYERGILYAEVSARLNAPQPVYACVKRRSKCVLNQVSR